MASMNYTSVRGECSAKRVGLVDPSVVCNSLRPVPNRTAMVNLDLQDSAIKYMQ